MGLELLEPVADHQLLVRGVHHRQELAERVLELIVALPGREALGDDKPDLAPWDKYALISGFGWVLYQRNTVNLNKGYRD